MDMRRPRFSPNPPGLAAHAGRGLCLVLALVLVTAAGLGWLYLLREAHALPSGPRVREALPLQRLAGDDRQPLLRLVVAWLPAGLVGGLALDAGSRLGRASRALAVGAVALVTLFAAGAVSDAVTASEPLSRYVGAQLGHPAAWLAAALMALAALIPPPSSRPPSVRRVGGGGAMRPRGDVSAAA
jgi:hypothetical protein